MNAEQLANRMLDLLINTPLVLPKACDICNQPLDFFNVVPGELIGLRHAACIDTERARTKRLCRRPYQLPWRRSDG